MDELSAKIMNEHKNLNLYIILGRGIYYGVANECMNKRKKWDSAILKDIMIWNTVMDQ